MGIITQRTSEFFVQKRNNLLREGYKKNQYSVLDVGKLK